MDSNKRQTDKTPKPVHPIRQYDSIRLTNHTPLADKIRLANNSLLDKTNNTPLANDSRLANDTPLDNNTRVDHRFAAPAAESIDWTLWSCG